MIERWKSYLKNLLEKSLQADGIRIVSNELGVVESALCFEAKRGFCSIMRYFQHMSIDGKETVSKWEHLNNKALVFANRKMYLLYTRSENEQVKDFVFTEVISPRIAANPQNGSIIVNADFEADGHRIQFDFKHLGLGKSLVPIDYAYTSSIFKDYQKRFGHIQLFAPFKWVSTVEHFSLHPVLVTEQAAKEAMIAGENKMREFFGDF